MPDPASTLRQLPATLAPAECWYWLAGEVRAFAADRHLDVRRVVVLLPFAQHLPLARGAWAQGTDAAWMPRFETTQTFADGVALSPAAAPGQLSMQIVADRLQAARLLRQAVPDWPRRDARGFDLATDRVVDTAQALARARAALPPDARPAWLSRAREALAASSGPDGRELALARLALEWSLSADTSGADALHAHRPAAWVALRAGAADALVEAVLAHAPVPSLRLDAQRPLEPLLAPGATLHLAACADLEDDAQRCAAQVLAHVARGERPVGLIALDRVLLRRVRALLERQQVPIADETGWKLSTTRAGTRIASLLRAAHPRARTDELLDALKSTPLDGAGLDALEAAWRRHGTSALRHVDPASLAEPAAALWQRWLAASEPLRATRRLTLGEWLQRLRRALVATGLWQPLLDDAAGVQALAALRCQGAADGGSDLSPVAAADPWAAHAADTQFDASAFRQWVEEVLEQVTFEPPMPLQDAAVVVTPLARAVLRPFAAVVCPGADAAHLGAARPPQPLLGDALAVALGLPGLAEQRAAEQQAFAQLLRAPRIELLHRASDGAEPLQPSPLLLRLQFAAERSGRPLSAMADERMLQAISPAPVLHPLPIGSALLSEQIDATAYEALRACPYRFFALHLLRLRDAEELDDAFDKRDYGSWLHAVLHEFHAHRAAPQTIAEDTTLLHAAARAQQQRLGRDDADFLPYAAWFERFAPRYLAWLQAQEAAGVRVRDNEVALRAQPSALAAIGIGLRGRLDRVDTVPVGANDALRIVDYKTSGGTKLRARLRDRLEDTQLAFYALLLAEAGPLPPGGIEALYLALDERDGPLALVHDDVEESAAELLGGMAHDLSRLRAGAPLPALGEGSACEHCDARGLCRRDHWSEVAAAGGGAG